MYIFSKATFKQARFSASQWPLSKISMFNIYIFPFRSTFYNHEMENGT